jgi:hypothetical protein
VDLDWHFVRKLAPLVLVLWGGSVLVRNRIVRKILLVLNAALIGVLVFSLIGFAWPTPAAEQNVEAYDRHLTEAFDGKVTHASLALKASAGRFTLKDTTSELIDASTHSTWGQFSLDRQHTEGADDLRMEFLGGHRIWRPGRLDNTASIRLNPNPVWRMDINAGAARVDADLRAFKTERVFIDAGASVVNVKLAALLDESRLKIHGGVSSIKVAIPETAGCEIQVYGGLSIKNFKGFTKINQHTYRTAQYEGAARKIMLDIDAGLSSIHVSRY